MSKMDTRLLRTFLSVSATGSFTATAQELAFAQSTVTAHIQALEQRLNVRLFDRLPARAVPTTYGRRLQPLARQILDLLAEVERLGDTSTGDCLIRLVAPDTLCGHRVPTAVALLRQRQPRLRVSVEAAGTGPALDRLGDGSADLALVFESELSGAACGGERIGTERLVIVASPRHPLARRRAGWPRLAQEPFLLLEEGCGYSDAVAHRLTMAGASKGRLSRFGSADAVRACVAAGLGLSVLPAMAVHDALRAGHLAQVFGSGLPAPRVLLVSRSGRADDSAMDAVAQALRAAFRVDRDGPGLTPSQPTHSRSDPSDG